MENTKNFKNTALEKAIFYREKVMRNFKILSDVTFQIGNIQGI